MKTSVRAGLLGAAVLCAFAATAAGGTRVLENAALKVVEDESSVSFFRRGAAEPFATMGRPAPEALKMSVRLDGDAPFAFLDFTPAATSGRIERVDAPYLTLSRTELCDPWKMRALGTGGLTPIDGHHGSYMYLALAEPVTRRGVVTAWLTSVKGSGTVGTRYVEGSVGVFPRLDYGCLAKEGMPCETFAVGAFDDCRLGLEAYADAVARRFAISLPPQISGYCTWYADRHEWSGDEASTKEFAELTKKMDLTKWGLSFYQIDDMWQDGELSNGPAKNFTRVDAKGPYPNGMKVAADAISAAGLRPGLWFMPFSGTDGGAWWADKRDLFVRGPDGRAPYRISWAGHPLDMSNPKAVAYVKDVVRRLTREWGFRYLKPDGIYTALAQQMTGGGDVVADDYGRQTFADPTFTGVEAYRAGVAAMREAAGKDVFILACGVGGGVLRVTGANYGLTDAARVGPDNGPWERRYMLGVKPTTLRYFYNGRVWYNDPDPVYLRATRPVGQARLFASWTAVAGMLWNFSDWIGDLPEDRLEILRRTLAPNTCRNVRPLDLFESDLPRAWHLEKDGYHIFDFCNWESREKGAFRYDAAYAGLDPKKAYVGFDFWNKAFVGPFVGELAAEVPPVDVKVWAVREVAERPVLVSTSRHVTSPVFEVTDEAWSGRTLSGVSSVVPGDAYELRVWAPKGFVCTSATAGDLKGEIRQEGSCLRVTFAPSSDRLAWRLAFCSF